MVVIYTLLKANHRLILSHVACTGGDGSCIRRRSVLAVSACEIAQLCKEDVLAAMDIFPELKIRINMFHPGRWAFPVDELPFVIPA